MPAKMSIWGIGPKIFASALGYAMIAGAASYFYPEIFLMTFIPYQVFLVLGIILLCLGLPMLAVAGRAAARAFKQNQLATTGIFGVVRNPIYSAWIVFIIPGLVLFSRSWLALFTPFIAYLAFKWLIVKENEYLHERFGRSYDEYRARVGEIIPLLRFRRK